MKSKSAVEREAEEVPNDIRRATSSLSSDKSYAIIVRLLKDGGDSFAELQEELGLHQQTLTNVLDKLQDGGFVVRKEIVEEGSNYRTKYEVSEFGKRILDSLYEAREPQITQDSSMLPLYRGRESEPHFEQIQVEEQEEVAATRLEDAEGLSGPQQLQREAGRDE